MAGGIGSKFNKALGSMPMRADPGQMKPAPSGFGGRSGPMGGAWGGTPMGATGAPPAAAAAGRAALGQQYGAAQSAMGAKPPPGGVPMGGALGGMAGAFGGRAAAPGMEQARAAAMARNPAGGMGPAMGMGRPTAPPPVNAAMGMKGPAPSALGPAMGMRGGPDPTGRAQAEASRAQAGLRTQQLAKARGGV